MIMISNMIIMIHLNMIMILLYSYISYSWDHQIMPRSAFVGAAAKSAAAAAMAVVGREVSTAHPPYEREGDRAITTANNC